MSLHQTLLSDLAAAMKAQDAQRLAVLRMLKAALLNESKAAGGDDTLDDDTVITLLNREAKKRKEAIEAYTQGDRTDLADQEKAELQIIDAYLPAQLSDEEITAAIDDVVGSMDAPQFGAVMGQVMKRVGAQADGDRVKALVNDRLNA